VTLPSPPGLQCLFALAVSLRARPPFTPPGPMAGKRFSGPDAAYPMSATQHDARAHPRRSRSRQRESSALLSLSSSSRHHRLKRIPITAPGDPLLSERPASGINLARILRPFCCVELDSGQGAKEQGIGPKTVCPPRCTSGTLCRRTSAAPGLELPGTGAPAKNRDPATPAKGSPNRTAQGAFHLPKHSAQSAEPSLLPPPRPVKAPARSVSLRLFDPIPPHPLTW
jgi:hypothetical protein